MRDHVPVKRWSERVDEEAQPGSPPPGTFYVAHYIQCRCGEVFVSRHSAASRSLLRVHRAQRTAEKRARGADLTGSRLRESGTRPGAQPNLGEKRSPERGGGNPYRRR
jgi:hypothetical protein